VHHVYILVELQLTIGSILVELAHHKPLACPRELCDSIPTYRRACSRSLEGAVANHSVDRMNTLARLLNWLLGLAEVGMGRTIQNPSLIGRRCPAPLKKNLCDR